MDISVLIVSFNTQPLTSACLQSVYAKTQNINLEVIIVDNQSTDGSPEAIAKQFPLARLIRPGRNIGFSAGNNLAAQHARGEYLLLLNPDTVILDRAIETLLAFARRTPQAEIIGGRTLFPDGTLNRTSCHGTPTLWSTFCLGSGLVALGRGTRLLDSESLGPWKRDSARQVPAVTGCFLLLAKSLWDSLGGFDESFFMYGEETDLCMRATERGHHCFICPEATIVHYGGASETLRTDKMVKLFKAKAQLFKRHWPPRSRWFGVLCLDLWAWTRMIAFFFLRWRSSRLAESYQTLRDIWRQRDQWHNVPLNQGPSQTTLPEVQA